MRVVVSGLVLGALGVLAGCSSGSGGEGSDWPPPLPEALSLDEVVVLGDAISAASRDLEFTDPAGLPTSGRAVYEGEMWIEAATYPEEVEGSVVPGFLLGQLAMGVDFSDGEVVGQAGNFHTSDGEAYGGRLAITGGELDRDVNPNGGGWTYEADIDGTLTRDDDWVKVEGEFLGDFVGEDHRFAEGRLDQGEIRGSDGTVFDLEGRFIAQR
jgi:hypothetical protein